MGIAMLETILEFIARLLGSGLGNGPAEINRIFACAVGQVPDLGRFVAAGRFRWALFTTAPNHHCRCQPEYHRQGEGSCMLGS